MNQKKNNGTPSVQRRLCCTTFLDQPHRPGCAFKARSVAYNRDLRKRLDAARTRGKGGGRDGEA
jgi:hypothetical protein